MKYTQAGNCPRCGAPIFAWYKTLEEGEAPGAWYTCDCRAALPTAFPNEPDDPDDTVAVADRKTMARHRPQAERASEETRAD